MIVLFQELTCYSDALFSTIQFSFAYRTLKNLSLVFTVNSFVENKLICMHHFCKGEVKVTG